VRLSRQAVPAVTWRSALVAVRTFLGLVYFTDGLSKLFGFDHFTLGPWSQYLITQSGAKAALAYDIRNAGIPIANDFARNFVLPNWGVIGWIVTAGELAVGLGLLLGLLGRTAALGGFLMAFMLFIWDLGAGGWTWDYLYDPVLLGILMLTPGLPGLDQVLRPRRHASLPKRPAHSEPSDALS
jgi:thiosulfate dehydrogenase [quinone] large subunit